MSQLQGLILLPLLTLPIIIQITVRNTFRDIDFLSTALIAGALLQVVDLVLLGMANRHFKRTCLILDQS